ncbi:MAG: ATP-binding cassette domain-containing protein [Verrucomicrobia bacterium]|nr:ATP-binding cassette domain-containing protein [Verrucomicrobiota bacterium]
MNAIEIRGIVKSYEKFKLGPIDLDVPEGSICGLIGPNGSGKTTLLELIFGLGIAEAGSIRVRGTGISYRHSPLGERGWVGDQPQPEDRPGYSR